MGRDEVLKWCSGTRHPSSSHVVGAGCPWVSAPPAAWCRALVATGVVRHHDAFPDKQLMTISQVSPWYPHIVNYIVSKKIITLWSKHDKNVFFKKLKNYFWDEPYLFCLGANNVLRRCVAEEEQSHILQMCHSSPSEGHFSGRKTATKILQLGFYWPSLFKDAHDYFKRCLECQSTYNISAKDMMLLNPIIIVKKFYVWGIDFMGPFPPSFGYKYILLAVDYVSKWIEAISTRTCDHKVVLKFLKSHIFSRFGCHAPLLAIMEHISLMLKLKLS